MKIAKRGTLKFDDSISRFTPRMFSRFVENPILFSPDGVLKESAPVPEKIPLITRIILYYGTESLGKYFVLADSPPINPKTGRSYGTDTQAYQKWADSLGAPPERIIVPEDVGEALRRAKFVQEHPVFKSFDIKHTDAIIASDESDEHTALVGWCDWVIAGPSGLQPAYHIAVEALSSPVAELCKRGKHMESLFTSRVLGDGVGRFTLVLQERGQTARVGVFQVEMGKYASSSVDSIVEEFWECKRKCEWPTRYEEARILSLPFKEPR